MRVISIGISFLNAAILTMDKQLCLQIYCNLTRPLNGFGPSFKDCGRPQSSDLAHAPSFAIGDDMLGVLRHYRIPLRLGSPKEV